MAQLPANTFIEEVGLAIKRGRDDKAKRLLNEAAELYKAAKAERDKTGSVRSYTLGRFTKAERRLENHLRTVEIRKFERAVKGQE
jgi:uncharacterized protein HemY